MVNNNPPSPALGWKILLTVAFRTFFLEASWNFVGQQNLGFAAAVNPALKLVYQNRPSDLMAARKRASTFFNTNPVISGLVIGAALKIEEEKARGLINDHQWKTLVITLASTMAIYGDSLFWKTWLPFCCLIGFGLSFLAAAKGQLTLAPLLIPILYCALAWPIRVGGLFIGYRLGRNAYTAVKKYQITRFALAIQMVSAFLIGYFTVRSVSFARKASGPNSDFFLLAFFLAILIPVLVQRIWPGLGPKTLFFLLVLGLGLALAFFN
ncbi:MAG: PTS system mannose/fructose/sorbose family transporter subunit IID [Deltaproteobacteria bacterium]|jgi:mannose/fructose/N-acetylgalactosamine-specific phosphotransferase system component IID|nr:PTS system mannose/fructose/sorbose family transporter subunit IID [Deltaproteobacteria bacterium]